MNSVLKTIFHDRHVALGAKMVEFGGWDMPLQYPGGIVEEHLATRKSAGLFDVSHMGRFIVRGAGATDFLQHVLTNNAAALDVGQSQYTMIPNPQGGAVDDAYLYRFVADEFLLVVNAANRQKDWDHFQAALPAFQAMLTDRTLELTMLSLQGPASKEILTGLLDSPVLPEPKRNQLCLGSIGGARVLIARTGYTGEPLCFELFIEERDSLRIWDRLVERGAVPVGLGARDTLRLEAGLPLYGHELGADPEGREIPIFACPLAKFAVSFSPRKGDFIGRSALARQYEAFKKITFGDYSALEDLPRIVMPVSVFGKNIARAGAPVYTGDGAERVGCVTSGTSVPYLKFAGEGLASRLTEERATRGVALALLRSDLRPHDRLQIDIRGRRTDAMVSPFHLRSEAPPYAKPSVFDGGEAKPAPASSGPTARKVQDLLEEAVANTVWRQRECINLIPSEMTHSPMARLLSVMDPSFRYAEHRSFKAFQDVEIFYYQGTDFICEVESRLEQELRRYLGCSNVETRAVSGQMANTVAFSAMVDYLNRANRREEPRRIGKVMNHGIIRGGHLSSQPMGALRDFVARDGRTETPAVVNFPVLADNPYKIDVAACRALLAEHRPELIIFGKSVTLHREPIEEIRAILRELDLRPVVMYDMAHVLGLLGPLFQEPFKEGADLVTGSTHKTFFGTQRGVLASNFAEKDPMYELWEAVERRTFPGAVSNHHLGTMLGLLVAAYEMNHFKEEYQRGVLANAKAFARALKECGLEVAGDPAVSYTETHQVVVNVGYGRGPEIARRLEENDLIVNYQASPTEEGFSAAGSIRMGVAEMTRFGMREADFQDVAQLLADVVLRGRRVVEEVKALRRRFQTLKFCFAGPEYDAAMKKLHSLI